MDFDVRRASSLFTSVLIDPVLLTNWENWVYSVGNVIVRVCPDSQRSSSAIQAECEWLNLLDDRGLRVGLPVESVNGRYVEQIEATGVLTNVSAFHVINGISPSLKEVASGNVLGQWACMIAKLHNLSQTANIDSIVKSRMSWFDDPLFAPPSYIAGEDALLVELMRAYDWMSKLPRTTSTYGLIHADCHPRNMLLQQGKLWFIDFDDGQSHWYLYDVAVLGAWMLIETAEGLALDELYREYCKHSVRDTGDLRFFHQLIRVRLLLDYALSCQRRIESSCDDWIARRKRKIRDLLFDCSDIASLSF